MDISISQSAQDWWKRCLGRQYGSLLCSLLLIPACWPRYTRTQILEATGSKSDDEAHWRQGPCLRLVQGFGHRITDKEPSILFYKDREATLCLKEILARFLKASSKTKTKTPWNSPNCKHLERAYCFNAEPAFSQQVPGARGLFRFSFYPWSTIVWCLLNGKEKMTMV